MHTKTLFMLQAMLASAALFTLGATVPARAANFQAINSPASAVHIPGKVLWVDLFTGDPDAASKFYCGLLGWTATPLEQKGKGYTVFSVGGRAVAGLVPRRLKGESHPSRWIGYYAVSDINATLALVEKNGGKLRAASRNFPDRGYQAIVSDISEVPIGVIQSSSGDAPDVELKPGDWDWFELYVTDPRATADFYHDTLGFDVAPETNADRKSDFVLSSAGEARGGVAPLPPGVNSKPSWLGVIRVANLDRSLATVRSLGGEVLVNPHSVEFGSRFAIVLDPTGGTVGLVQYMDNANPAVTP
jgi:predicted enzyme related to lactoylglutathione lyase